ncbi:unnamed protein product, partial [Dovyalis caffra]
MNIPIPHVETYDDRHMKVEDPQGLNIEELQKLEKLIEESLCRVLEKKVRASLVGEELIKENRRLKRH